VVVQADQFSPLSTIVICPTTPAAGAEPAPCQPVPGPKRSSGTPQHIKQCQAATNDEEKRQVNAATQSPFRMIAL
jgi:hypothetical protein